MDDFLELFETDPDVWNAAQVFLSIGTSFVLGMFVSWIYRWTNRQLTVSFSFVNTLVLVSMIMAMVIMGIGNNVARAFGLAGAMSIIRFRTVVKDTRDTAFVFYALGVGMAAGTGNLMIALIGTLLIGFFIAILHWLRHGVSDQDAYLLSFDTYTGVVENAERSWSEVFDRSFQSCRLSGVKSARVGDVSRYYYHVILNESVDAATVVAELAGLEGPHRISLTVDKEGES